MLPGDEDAKRLARQTFTLSEFLSKHAPAFKIPKLPRRAIVHGHCHEKAIMKMDAETAMLDRLGLDYDLLDSGCCGMAGSFGFERGHYDISMRVGELVVLPAVRKASKDTLIVADGFSCREQIAQATDRRALHTAEVLQMACNQSQAVATTDYPERAVIRDHGAGARQVVEGVMAGLVIGAAAAASVIATLVLTKGRGSM
jgi:Fe-S oxidoreductase